MTSTLAEIMNGFKRFLGERRWGAEKQIPNSCGTRLGGRVSVPLVMRGKTEKPEAGAGDSPVLSLSLSAERLSSFVPLPLPLATFSGID